MTADRPHGRRSVAAKHVALAIGLAATIVASGASAAVWSTAPSAPPASALRVGAVAIGYADGSAIVMQTAGAAGAVQAFRLDPATRTWSSIASPPLHGCEALLPLPGGDALCAFGVVEGGTTRATSAYRWWKATDTWTTVGAPTDREHPFAVVLKDGRALVCGGESPADGTTMLTTCQIFDPSSSTWSAAPSMPAARFALGGGVVLADGRVAIIAGTTPGGPPGPTLFFDPTTSSWTTSSSGVSPSPASLAVTETGAIAFVGPAGSIYDLDPATGQSTQLPGPTTFRTDMLVNVGPRWVLLLGQAFLSTPQPEQAVLLDPQTRTYHAIPAPPSGANASFLATRAADSALIIGGQKLSGSTFSDVTATDLITLARDGVACADPDGCSSLGCSGGKCGAGCAADGDCATGTSCAKGTCQGQLAIGDACDRDGRCGSGHCVDARCCSDPKGCAPYLCDASGGCTKSCADAGGCSKGNICSSGSCVPDPTVAACSDDLTQSVPKVGAPSACLPFVCDTSTGLCRKSCTSSDQCAGGFQCDTTQTQCVRADAGGSDGGCDATKAGNPGLHGAAGTALATLILGLVRARRRRVRGAGRQASRRLLRSGQAPDRRSAAGE
jgi:hypothetical protein